MQCNFAYRRFKKVDKLGSESVDIYQIRLTPLLSMVKHYYDFDEGGLTFVVPSQLIRAMRGKVDYSGDTLLFNRILSATIHLDTIALQRVVN